MSSVFAHVDPDVQPVLLQSNGDRIRFIAKSGFVEWPQATEALRSSPSAREIPCHSQGSS